jgi:hypothetical protein
MAGEAIRRFQDSGANRLFEDFALHRMAKIAG